MSIATTSLRYGWKVLAILTIGTGTIFVADNVLNRIATKDRIEVTLAVVERCLATQYSTNPVRYRVAPPSIVRTWTDTDGASISMTNALEWRDDLSMKVELDAKIQALCPYYVNTNSVYNGTTNIIMHTFTGLLASLNLGNHTNFTAIPAIGTNVATFGPWAWRNYVVAWQERYKVLNALQVFRIPRVSIKASYERYYGQGISTSSWIAAQSIVVTNFSRYEVFTNAYLDIDYFYCLYTGDKVASYPDYWRARAYADYLQTFFIPGPTNINHRDSVFINVAGTNDFTPIYTFDGQGLPVSVGVYSLIYQQAAWNNDATVELPLSFGLQSIPNISDDPGSGSASRGFASFFAYYDELWVNREFQFNYATNRFWE